MKEKQFLFIIIFLVTLFSSCKVFDEDNNPGVSYRYATLSHAGFDFSEGKSDTINWQNNDGDIVNWSPVNPQKRNKLWYRPGAGISPELSPGKCQKNMGNISLDSIIDIPANFDPDPDPLYVGNSYVVKCFDGFAKFKVLELGDDINWWAKVEYKFTNNNKFDN